MYRGATNRHSRRHHSPLPLPFLCLFGWRACRVRGGAVVGELVVDAKFPSFQLVSIPTRLHGVVYVGKIDKGGDTLRWVLLGKNVNLFNLAEPAEFVRTACVCSQSVPRLYFDSLSVCVRTCVCSVCVCMCGSRTPLVA